MDKSLFCIFKTFFRIGTLLLGGGYVILPLLQSEIAQKKGWVTSEELCEYFAISSSLPGIIAINVAIFTGRKIAGTKGAIAAITGVVMPAFLAIVLFASIITEIVQFKIVQNIFWGISIGVITLLVLAVKEMWNNCVNDKFSVSVYLICLILALLTKISPVWIVLFAIAAGLIYQKVKTIKEKNNV